MLVYYLEMPDVAATGSRPFVPPMAGTDKEGVFRFRTLDDCRAIASFARGRKNAVVIGGGLLGLETARRLTRWYSSSMENTTGGWRWRPLDNV